jgi:hypothetical protein
MVQYNETPIKLLDCDVTIYFFNSYKIVDIL